MYGAWDALIALAGELERLFHRFAEQNLKDFAGPEGKTITMALALAPAVDASLGAVFEEAGAETGSRQERRQRLYLAVGPHARMEAVRRGRGAQGFAGAHDRGVRLLGTVFEGSVRHLSRDAIPDVAQAGAQDGRRKAVALSSPHRPDSERLARARHRRGSRRGDYQKARTALIADLIGRSAVTVKLRPAGRVALEWARLSAEA